MRCYKCGSVLSETDYCNGCGTDVVLYKRIVKMSNTYYNMGLAKAKNRDLSGAADLLRRSVRIDKKNIQARNLLGLVYLEMGEVVEALSQWVISKNIKPEKNIADEYLKNIQSNMSKLDAVNVTIKKFNTALGYANEGNEDLAIIQLKKVINLNPNFIKAFQLLALLYIKKEEYAKAKKYLDKTLLIDFNNTLSIKYLNEIEILTKEVVKKSKKDAERKALSGNDVIIPESSYKDVNYGLMQFLTLVGGILIGMAMLYFIVIPAKEKDIKSDYSDQLNDYADIVSGLNLEIDGYDGTINELESQNKELTAQIEELNSQPQLEKVYTDIVEAVGLYVDGDKAGCGEKLLEIDMTKEYNAEFTALYTKLFEATSTETYGTYYNAAYKAENEKKYKDAIEAFKICEKIQPENVEILYHIGKCYKMLNNDVVDENAKAYFEKVIELEPDSQFAGWATSNLN